DDAVIAYARMWAYAGSTYHDRLRERLREDPLASAHALVLDLRGGWGGADPSYADYFLSRTSTLTMTMRNGDSTRFNDHWHKPLVVLIDEGTRSGKEVLAATLQAHGVPLVGSVTAGAVTGGRPFALLDDSVLYLAVGRVEVDGEQLEGRGVSPDLPVPRTLAYAAGRDLQRERALALANCLITSQAGLADCLPPRDR
ncbi:MAG: S41 family peptidase, partial [Pseudomonadota bacterium]